MQAAANVLGWTVVVCTPSGAPFAIVNVPVVGLPSPAPKPTLLRAVNLSLQWRPGKRTLNLK